MKKIILNCTLIMIVIIVFIGGLILINSKDNVKIIKKDSYFSDFNVRNDKVYIKCVVTIKNTYNDNKKINLYAIMDDDVNIGLLKEEQIFALNDDDTKAEYKIKGNSEETFDVVFTGDFAGVMKKHDKLLPKIEIEIIR